MVEWSTIAAAIGVTLGSDKVAGRQELLACWRQIGETHHAQRCVLAHYLADLEEDLDAEIAWDMRALVEHAHLSDSDLSTVGIPSARGLLPSLHLGPRRGDPWRLTGPSLGIPSSPGGSSRRTS